MGLNWGEEQRNTGEEGVKKDTLGTRGRQRWRWDEDIISSEA